MKTLKKALQRNCVINNSWYTDHELEIMVEKEEIFKLREGDEYRIECDNSELKVILDEYGYYTNVLVKNGKKYYVKLH